MNFLKMAGVGFLGVALAGSAGAQGNMGGGTGASAAKVAPAASLDAMLSGFEGEMMGVAKAMPAERYGFAPSAAIFKETQGTQYEGVRSFGAMIGHIAQANYYYYAAVGGTKPAVDMKAIGAMTSKDDLIAALTASFAFAHRAVATITVENAFEKVGTSGMSTRASLAGGGVAHGFDHYGQLVEYLRMNGMTPPASAK